MASIPIAAARAREIHPQAHAVLYARVSTDAQARSGLGLDAQRAAMRAFARDKLRLPIRSEHADEGLSGALPLEKRPGLLDAINALRRRAGDVLVVATRDRLGRDVLNVALIEDLVAKKGARIACAAAGEEISGDDATRVMVQGILDVLAQYERSLIALRVRKALQAKRARGESAGALPYGYRIKPGTGHATATGAASGTLVPVPKELAALEVIRELRAGGASLRAIAAELARRGIPPKAGGKATGGRWQASSVRSVLRTAAAGGTTGGA